MPSPAATLVHASALNVLLQLLLRVLTFVLNALLLRRVAPALLGIANVRLLLLYSTALFVAREPFRRACISAPEHWRQARSIAWCVLPYSWLVCGVLAAVWAGVLSQPLEVGVSNYRWAIAAYSISVLLECSVEPLFLYGQSHSFVRLKVAAEGLLNMSRGVLAYLFTLYLAPTGLQAFALSMLLSSSLYALLYVTYFFRAGYLNDILPKGDVMDAGRLDLVKSFWLHSIAKQLLTEGERFVMTFTGVLSFADQGIFDAISNLASLVPRLLFAPIEESSYAYFTQTVQRSVPAKKQTEEGRSFVEATGILRFLLKGCLLIGLLAVTFGVPFGPLALQLYGGQTLIQPPGPLLVKVYCVYIAIMALNGIVECFAFAAMDHQSVDRHKRSMFYSCVIFLLASWILTKLLGSVGFIIANCVNMLYRIGYCAVFIRCFYRDVPENMKLNDVLPRPQLMCLSLLLFVGLCFGESMLCCDNWKLILAYVSSGVLALFLVVIALFRYETDLTTVLRRALQKSRAKRE